MISLWASGIKPTLSLNFAGANTLDSLFTFTRSGAQTYFDSTGTLQTATTNVAAFDYDPSTLAPLGLSMWEARTNLLKYSETFNNAAWATNSATITADSIASPDGTVSADTYVEGTGTITPYVEQRTITTPTNVAMTFNIFLKYNGRSTVILKVYDSVAANGFGATVTLLSGTIGACIATGTGTATSSSIKALNNGWYLCSISGIPASANSGSLYSVRVEPFNVSTTYTGDGVSGVYLWGADLQVGAFATPYIATVAAAATRAAPVCSTTNLGWYNATQGTLLVSQSYATGSLTASPTEGQVVRIWDGSGSNLMALRFVTDLTAPQLDSVGVVSGVNQWDTAGYASLTPNTTVKSALAYAANDVAQVTNGGAAQTDTSCSIPVVDRLTFLLFRGGWISSLTYYPLRLPNSTLQALTA